MLVFLDTEFTNFVDSELLSLGLVTFGPNQREFYVELDLSTRIGRARRSDSSKFVKYRGVLKQLGRVQGATADEIGMGLRVGLWLLELAREASERIEVAFDYPTDWALQGAGLWERVREVLVPVNVAAPYSSREGALAADDAYRTMSSRGLNQHHALADAHALRAAYRANNVRQ